MSTATKKPKKDAERSAPLKPLKGQTSMCELHGEGEPKRIRMKRDVEGLLGLVAERGREMDVSGIAPTGLGLVVRWDADHEMIVKPDDFEVIERHEFVTEGLGKQLWRIAQGERPKRVELTKKVYPGVNKERVLEPPEQFDVVAVGDYSFTIDAGKYGHVVILVGQCKVIAWHDATKPGERRPKVVRLLRQEQMGLTGVVPPGEYEYVGPGRPGQVMIKLPKAGAATVPLKSIEVIEWHDDAPPATKPEPTSKPILAAARELKPAKANGKATAAASKADIVAIAELPTEPLALALLERHPKNRHPAAADVAVVAASMKEVGQLEALVVRRWNAAATGFRTGFYQIISGETRSLAAKKNGDTHVACRVIECSDARALELLAIYNAKRKDLDPIQKAQMIVELCKPVADGGSDYTREQAAKMYDLESGSAASNLVRLLELPEVWQQRVIKGELSQRIARVLTPYAAAPKLMQRFDENWLLAYDEKEGDAYERDNWMSPEMLENFARGVVRASTRSLDSKADHWYQEAGKRLPRLFELNDETRAKVEAVKLKVDGKVCEYATNVDAFNELQLPLVLAKVTKSRKGKAAAAGADEPAPKEKELTPAQRKKAAADKAEKLEEHLDGWRHAWLKKRIVDELAPEHVAFRSVAGKAIAALMLDGSERQVVTTGLSETTPKGTRLMHGAMAEAYRIADRLADDGLDAWYQAALRVILSEEDPEPRRPRLKFEFVDAIAAEMEFDLVEEWRAMQTTGPRFDRDRLEEFLLHHTTDQLRAQAEEWKVFVDTGKTKRVMIDVLLGQTKALTLPKSIKPLPTIKPTKKPAAAAAKKPAAKKGAKSR